MRGMNGLINIFRTKKARLFWLCALLCLFCCSIPSFTMAKEESGELPSCSSLETAGSKPCVCESRWLGSDLVCQTGELCVEETIMNTGKDASQYTRMICKKINTKNPEKTAVSSEGIGSQQLYENVQGKDAEKYETKINYNETQQASDVDPSCESIDTIRAKYQGGCWSCLVIEKLTSAFLTAASKAYGLAQRAGLIALMLGAVLWVLVWGLKNVSSVSQINAPNILDELLKMAFKIALAYLFIISGLPIVRNYFINPIMGTGAVIAQQFWVGELEDQVEDYDWGEWSDEDWNRIHMEADIAEAADKIKQQQEESSPNQTPIPELSGVSDENAEKVANANDQKTGSSQLNGKIPDFKLPGTNGRLTSAFGCRPRPKVRCNGKNSRCGGCRGSNWHAGIDIGAPNGTPIYAIGSGTIVYAQDSSCGYYARITHDGGSGTWQSVYCHMLPKSQNYAINYNKTAAAKTQKNLNTRQVSKGQIIGFVGNTGASGGNHLHLGIKYNNNQINPLKLASGIIDNELDAKGNRKCPQCPTESDRTPTPFGFKRYGTVFNDGGIMIGGDAIVLGSSGSYENLENAATLTISIPDVTYTGPTDILSKSVMNNILTATKVITDNTAETMVLGDSIMCCAKTENCGAWKLNLLITDVTLTNIWMWLEGAIIFCIGVMLTLAVAYYLVDISFKISFAVIALPIVVGLWPFKLTSGKFTNCLSIILKSAAIYAFLAITTFFAMQMIAACFDIENANEEAAGAYQGIFEIIQSALDGEDQSDLISEKLALFSTNFILLCFCLVYAFKIIQASTNEFTDKFFSDAVFGGEVPIHHNLTAATKAAKDLAMKPIGFGRDVITHQSGRLLTHVYNRIRHSSFGGSGEATGKGVKQFGKVMKKAGQGIDKAGAALNKTKYGAIIGVPLQAAGKTTQAVGAVTEKAGQATEKAGKAIRKTQQKMKTSARILKRRLLKQNNSSES